jgi:hypothetical protein
MEKKIVKKRFQLKREEIVLFQFILESYEGIATVSTIDSTKDAVVEVHVMHDFVREIENILQSMKKNCAFIEMQEGL